MTQRFAPIGAEGGWMLEPASRLPSGITLECIAERRFGVKLQRISRVVAIAPQSPAIAEDAGRKAGAALISPTTITHASAGN